jgi:ABC-type multidrug transport system ATPase subunit
MTSYLQFENVEKRFGRVCALEGIDLAVEQGSTLALLGPNGAGKSTLFSCLLGFATPSRGNIKFRGHNLRAEHRANFGYVSERVALYGHRSVLENTTFFAELKGVSDLEVRRQLERVQLADVSERKVRQLSKGMLQRLGLAIALLGEPELIVLDEPFNGLDPVLLDKFMSIIREEQSRGATFIISTHTISAIEPLASHVAILLYGHLAYRGSVEELRATKGSSGSLKNIYHQIARHKHANTPEEVRV